MKRFITSILFNMLMGALISLMVGFSATLGAAVGVVAGVFVMPSVGLHVAVFREVWTGEMYKAFRNSLASIGWLPKCLNKSKYAENDVIHFVDLGGDPDVLVNNTSYPIEVQDLPDGDKAVKLDCYVTKATPITDDEAYASSYDKMASVIERHREKVDETKIAKALHSLSPASNKAETPVFLTTGANNNADGRKVLTRSDILALKKAFDKAKVPTAGRILVLCPDHVNDLLENDQKFSEQYYNYNTGKIANLYGFEVYEYVDCPSYDVTTKTKRAFGAVAGANDMQASVAFLAGNSIYIEGSTKTYISEAKNDPTHQRNLFNLRHYFIALPLKERAMGAIVSAKISA